MDIIFQGNWNNLTARQYLELVGLRTIAYWIGNIIGVDPDGNKIMRFPIDIAEGIFHVTQTRTHTCNIESSTDWLSFIHSCYSLGCINCENEGWMAINGQKQSFRQWMTAESVINDPSYFKFDGQRFSDRIFCTVFDTRKQKRLIVDGLHRAKALTEGCDEGRISIPIVTIVECLGDRVDVIFPCDIHQLPS
jgi:hypothetical protein